MNNFSKLTDKFMNWYIEESKIRMQKAIQDMILYDTGYIKIEVEEDDEEYV